MTYDRAATLRSTCAPPCGLRDAVAAARGQLRQAERARRVRRVTVRAGTSTTVTGLWPDSGRLLGFSGSCKDADPAGPPTGGTRGPPS